MRKLLLLLLCSTPIWALSQQDEQVNLVISSGIGEGTCVAFSPKNDLMASVHISAIKFWDVKTGREIRTVAFTEDITHSADSIWFEEDGTHLLVSILGQMNKYRVDVQKGTSTFVPSNEEYDWTKYKMPTYAKASTHLQSADKSDFVITSPDAGTKVLFRKIKNPNPGMREILPNVYLILVEQDGKEWETGDTTFFGTAAFSQDSKFLYVHNRIYDLHPFRAVSELVIAPPVGMGVGFVPGTHIPITCGVGSLRLWDFPNIEDIKVKKVGGFMAAPGGHELLCHSFSDEGKPKDYMVVDLDGKKVVHRTRTRDLMSNPSGVGAGAEHYSTIEVQVNTKVNPPKTKFVGKVMNAKSGKVEHEFSTSSQIRFTPNPNILILDSLGNSMHRYDVNSKEASLVGGADSSQFSYRSHMSMDNSLIMGYSMYVSQQGKVSYRVRAWDVLTDEVKFDKEVEGVFFTAFEVSKDKGLFAFSNESDGHRIYIYDMQSGELRYKLEGHTGMLYEMAFSDDNQRLLTSSIDGTRKLWNLETGKLMVSLISTGKDDYAIVAPDQYYYATKGARQSIHFVKGTQVYPFEQFDLKYNRPDIIMERMLASNEELIKSYYWAYKKRLKRMGFTEDMLSGDFHLPEAEITNADAYTYATEEASIRIDISAKDKKYNLNRLMVRVNGVPIHGTQGIDLSSQRTQNLKENLEIVLSAGSNKISVSVYNEKGVESIASHMHIKYAPKVAVKPKLYLMALGVSKYASEEFNLKYAAKDANDLSAFLGEGNATFSEVETHLLTDGEVTQASVAKLKALLKNTSEDDVVCVFFAGHGVLDTALNYFLASHDMEFTNPAVKGIAYEQLESLLDGIPARRKLMLIDACHSGEIDKEEVTLASESVEIDGPIAFRSVNATTTKRIGLSNSFELMTELFTDIRKSSGAMIISSAGGTEFAMEGDQWSNGVFTYCLLNGMVTGAADLNGNGEVMIGELNAYVREKVVDLTRGMQKPTTRAEALDVDWRIW